MVGDNGVCPAGNGFIEESDTWIQAKENGGHTGLGVADQKPHVVPFFGQGEGGEPVKGSQEVANLHAHDPRLQAKFMAGNKKRYIPAGVYLFVSFRLNQR
jgi:hypothetical protein